ncbi:MAG: 6-carboxytetrahydropterin synthase QueD [Gammaproteobacteria bacterium]|nr:6-carboxytetrahydropterin synthase QueD [Gammaproteobacteria bacterium]
MPARYTLRIFTDFSAAHFLRNYEGKCARLHGHNWKIEVEVITTKLDEVGMGLDFQIMKGETKTLLEELDHYNLNDMPPFDKINPTAENLAAYIYQRLSERINDGRVTLSAITVWETDRACVRYTEE